MFSCPVIHFLAEKVLDFYHIFMFGKNVSELYMKGRLVHQTVNNNTFGILTQF